MFHPSILQMLAYRLRQCQQNLSDACDDTARFYGICPHALYYFYKGVA